MTEQELKVEWQYLYDERLAILGCYGTPPKELHDVAKKEADEAIKQLKDQPDLL